MPTSATEDLYMQSVLASADHYGIELKAVSAQTLLLDNRDFDTGLETKAGEYSLTDLTYSDLLAHLAEECFSQVTPELQANVLAFYSNTSPPAFAAKSPGKWQKTLANLAAFRALTPATAPAEVPASTPGTASSHEKFTELDGTLSRSSKTMDASNRISQ